MALGAATLTEQLQKAGYRTGIFGKWHLGDEAEYQPNKRGFDEVFIHGAGGIGQSYPGSCGDVPGNSYYGPTILHNGKFVKTSGYCTDEFFAQATRWIEGEAAAKRPFADAIRSHPLPASGMTVNLSRITTSTSTAVQSSENSNVSETDIDDTLMTINVQTNAGRQTLSRQAVERGSGVEDVVLRDRCHRLVALMNPAEHRNMPRQLVSASSAIWAARYSSLSNCPAIIG